MEAAYSTEKDDIHPHSYAAVNPQGCHTALNDQNPLYSNHQNRFFIPRCAGDAHHLLFYFHILSRRVYFFLINLATHVCRRVALFPLCNHLFCVW